MKKLMFPCLVAAALALASLACLDTNYYGVQPPAVVRAEPSAADVAANQELGSNFAGVIALVVLIFWSFFHMSGKLPRLDSGQALIYQGCYWLLLLVGLGMFAWGVLVPPIILAWIIGGVVQIFLAAMWGLLGNRLFGV